MSSVDLGRLGAWGHLDSLPIEEVLLADCTDVVRDCSVIGVPGPSGGQVPIAVPYSSRAATTRKTPA